MKYIHKNKNKTTKLYLWARKLSNTEYNVSKFDENIDKNNSCSPSKKK